MLEMTGKTTRPFRLIGPLVAVLLGCLLILVGPPRAWATPAWLPAADLSAPGKDATNAAVATDAAGDTVAVWERQDTLSSSLNVQVATRSPGAGFSAPADLSHFSTEPDVAMTPAGEAVAVWRHFDVNNSGNYVIQASTRPPGGSFSDPVDIATLLNAALPQNLEVAVNAAGDMALVWTQFDPTSGLFPNPSFVEASIRPAGGSFSPPVQISPTPLVAGQSASNPRVALDAAGNTTVVWAYQDGTNQVIQAATRPANGSFSLPTPLTVDGADASSPDVAMDSAGDSIAVWTHSDGTNFIAQESSSQAGGPFAAPVDLSEAGANASSPRVAMTPSGAATVAWSRPDTGGYSIVQISTGSVGGFSAPVDLSATGQNASDPEVAVNAADDATVVWRRSNGLNSIAQGSTRQAGGSFTPAVDLSAAGQDAVSPQVAMDAEGDATAVWYPPTGTTFVAQAAGYDADAPELRDVSIPPSGMVGIPVSFSVSPFDIWPIASTSFDFGDGAAADGTSVSHAYGAPGSYQVTVTSKDAAGTPVSASGTIAILPSNQFAIGRLSLNRKRGTGTFVVTVPGPGKLVLAGKAVKRATKRVKRAAKVKLPIRALGKALRHLERQGKVRVALAISFTPNGGTTLFKHKTVTLVKKLSG